MTTVQYIMANGTAITVRLLCDGTNLRIGGEVKGRQDSEVSKPVSGHSNAEISCSERVWTLFQPHATVACCTCAITL
jgi:hypothetical protein